MKLWSFPLLLFCGLTPLHEVRSAVTPLRLDDTQGGFTTHTPGLADAPVNDVPPPGANDDAWGFSTTNTQALYGSGNPETTHLANYLWASRVDLGESAPNLTTTVSGLDVGETYTIYGYYVSHDTASWAVRIGLEGGDLTQYGNSEGDILEEVSTSNLNRASLGQITGQTGFTIEWAQRTSGASARSFIKGIGIEVADPNQLPGNAAGRYIHGEGHAIAAKWKSATVSADIGVSGLTYSDALHSLRAAPGRVVLSFDGTTADDPLHATLDTRSSGAFAGLLTSGLIDKSGDSLYFSVLLRIPSEADPTDLACFALSSSPGAGNWDGTEILRVGKIPGQGFLSCQIPATAAVLPSTIAPDGATHLLVGRIDFASGTDTLTVWLDPELSLTETDPSQVTPLGTSTGAFAFKGYQFRGDTPFEADEVRIGETWRSVLPVRDSDLDGLDDEWERTYWGDLSPLPNDDPDEDGQPNLAESTAGTHPLRASSTLTTEFGGLPSIHVLEWYSAPQRYYRIQESTNLVDWIDLDEEYAGDGRVFMAELPASTEPRRFYRLAVSSEPAPGSP